MPPSRTALTTPALVLAFTFPLLVSRHTLPLATFYGEWVSGLLFAMLVLVCTMSRRAKEPRQPLLPWIALFPLWLIATSLLQAASGFDDVTGSRLTTILTLALGAAVVLAAWRTQRNGDAADNRQSTLDALAIAWLIAGLAGTLAQWVQVFRLEPDSFGLVSTYFYDDNRRLWGNLNQPNHQATVEGLALAASVWLAWRGWLRFPAWLVAVILLESGIVLSGSRTGVLHVGLAAIYAMVAAWLARDATAAQRTTSDNPMQRPTGLAVAALAIVVAMLLLQPAIKTAAHAFDWRLFDAVAQLKAGDQVSARGALWTHAIAIFRAHPWLGVGWGEFGWAQFQQLTQVGVTAEMALHAHNAVLDLLAKTGVVGAAGVGLFLLAWLWRVVRHRLWRAGADERRRTVLALAWLAMLSAHSMLEYPLHYLYFFLPFCFLLGWLEPSGFGPARLPRALTAVAALAFVVATAGVLATLWQDYRRVEAREYATNGRRDALPVPAFWFRQHLHADQAERAVITAANARQQLPAHVAAVHLLPTPTMISRTAWLFALTGDPAQGRAWMERLRYYYAGDEAAQLASLDRDCAAVAAATRPRSFCDWVHAQSRRHPE